MPWKPRGDEWEPFPSLGGLFCGWMEANLVIPDGNLAGHPFRVTDSQYAHFWHLFRLNPDAEYDPMDSVANNESRAAVYTTSVFSRAKGSGRSPLLGAASWAAALGPVLFGGWDEDGQPIGLPHPNPWVQIMGYSQKSTKNLWSSLMLTADRDMGAAALMDRDDISIGRSQVILPNGIMEFVTASPGSLEGNRVTFGVIEESGYMLPANSGIEVAAVLERNRQKTGGKIVQISNAYVPGQQSVMESAHDYVKAHAAGKVRGNLSVYWDHREFPPDTNIHDEDSLRKGLKYVYQDSTWVPIESIINTFYDTRTPIASSRRFFGNQITAAVDAWISNPEWGACKRDDVTVLPEEPITLGFDGSIRDDSTALVGCRVSDGHLFLLGVWEKPFGKDGIGWEVDREDVDATLASAFDSYNVVGMFADQAHWSDRVDVWRKLYGQKLKVSSGSSVNPMYFAMNRNLMVITALDRFLQATLAKELSHDGNIIMEQHILNCRRRISRSGIQIAKEYPSSPNKIDVAMAAMLAYECTATVRREFKPKVQGRIFRINQ